MNPGFLQTSNVKLSGTIVSCIAKTSILDVQAVFGYSDGYSDSFKLYIYVLGDRILYTFNLFIYTYVL